MSMRDLKQRMLTLISLKQERTTRLEDQALLTNLKYSISALQGCNSRLIPLISMLSSLHEKTRKKTIPATLIRPSRAFLSLIIFTTTKLIPAMRMVCSCMENLPSTYRATACGMTAKRLLLNSTATMLAEFPDG